MLVAAFPAGSFQTNCYVVAPAAGEQCVVVDPGEQSPYTAAGADRHLLDAPAAFELALSTREKLDRLPVGWWHLWRCLSDRWRALMKDIFAVALRVLPGRLIDGNFIPSRTGWQASSMLGLDCSTHLCSNPILASTGGEFRDMKTTKRNIAVTSMLLVGSMLLAACGADASE